MQRIFFIDFDGTITRKDVCEAMVEKFAADGWQEINHLWEMRKISTEECANRTFQLFRAGLEDLDMLLDTIAIDEHFKDFADYCRSKGHPLYILSDGYDYIIEYILKKHNLRVEYFSNKLIYNDGFAIYCPLHNPECGICGTCKSTLMTRLNPEGRQAVYIGDGTSDLCPASAADMVFAKGRLLEYCRNKGIKVHPFDNFGDILSWLVLEEGNQA
ncbi:MAG: MtnX-like HAD-IB family phosphatase [Clostridiales bacterium]|nr:MtnX-like HAD-IB family phosphatase [Clostridiales bacterium]